MTVPSDRRTGFFGNHPILVATTAASGGVLLGAYVAVQLFASPVQQQGPGASGPQPVAASNASAKAPEPRSEPRLEPKAPVPQPKAAVNAAPETTGSAPAKEKEDVAAADRCAGQTWPYLSRECTEQMQGNRRATRAMAPDRVDRAAPETSVANSADSNAAPSAPAAAPALSAPNTAVASAPPAPPPAVQPSDPQASTPAPPAAVPAASLSDPQDVASANAATDSAASKAAEKRKVREAKRKAKKPKTEPTTEESDDNALALAARDERNRGEDEWADRADRVERRSLRAESRSDRYRRERAIVSRDGDDDSASERGGRRVIVIGREGRAGFGGIFGNLFGN